ncbi:hypothetical protein FA503_00965 [Pseudomonas aeruginosa]|nr:hypothetical protein [Pseudomonas aeruginosa]RTX55904.1 hypothetical protein DZA23_12635 [Pseudomonas aeruginosa]
MVRGETGDRNETGDQVSGRLLLDYQPTRTFQGGADARQGREPGQGAAPSWLREFPLACKLAEASVAGVAGPASGRPAD